MSDDRLAFQGVGKSFGAVRALHEVSFSVKPGAVHGLIGENGAGKSTLLKILSGVQLPDRGDIRLNGRPLAATSPLAARRSGIAMIHQELQHVPELTVAQNLFLGRPLTRWGGMWVDSPRQEAEAQTVLAGLDPHIAPRARIGDLKVAQRQLVEIARALIDKAQVVAMDEPTSSLTPSEVDRLAVLIADLSRNGVSVIYVSHRMDEIFQFCSRATILRDGEVVADTDLAATTKTEVVAKMVGRTLLTTTHTSYATTTEALRVENLARPPSVKHASFVVHRGEVLGIAGLVGAGRTELVRLVAGVDRPSAGTIEVFGQTLAPGSVRRAIKAGLGLVPEERRREGIVPLRPVDRNMALPAFKRFVQGGLVRRAKLTQEATDVMASMDLRPLDVGRPIAKFSGGNQQKVIIGRWLMAGAEILLFDEPTRGIDVGAKAEIYTLIEALAASGKAIVVVSSELPELIRLADRVIVMREGEIAATLSRQSLTEEAIMDHAVPGVVAAQAASAAAP